MAKKKPSLFDYVTGSGKLGKAMDRYGVEGVRFGGRPGEGDGPRLMEDVDRDLAKAAMNDYDTRRTMEAQAMAGKKKAKKFAEEGFSDATDVIKANNMFERWHRKQGNGGEFSSASDFAGLTHNSVERDRKKQDREYDNKLSELEKQMKKARRGAGGEEAPRPDVEMSDRMQRGQDLLASYTAGLAGGGTGMDYSFSADPFDTRDAEVGLESPTGPIPDNSTDGFGSEPGTENITDDSYIDNTNENAAEAFREKYKFNVKEGLNLAGVPTRGPGTSFGA